MNDNVSIPAGNVPPGRTAQQIHAEGDVKVRTLVIWLIGVLLVIITVGSFVGLIVNEPVFEKHWQGFQAIISGAIFGLVGFIAGRSSRES
ncbi:MAG: hypothetical protein ACYC0T_11430 [Ramlibacter sp.]